MYGIKGQEDLGALWQNELEDIRSDEELFGVRLVALHGQVDMAKSKRDIFLDTRRVERRVATITIRRLFFYKQDSHLQTRTQNYLM